MQHLFAPSPSQIRLEMLPQPDDQTCGPTCLRSVYAYYGLNLSLESVVAQVPQLEEGGTLGVILANHALKRGFRVSIYTYNLQVFDPTWFKNDGTSLELLSDRLRARSSCKTERKIRRAIREYTTFLGLGGEIRFEDLTQELLRRFLKSGRPLLTGLSATYLYSCARELNSEYDDIRGEPTGHFVVLCDYDSDQELVTVADPLLPNPVSSGHFYQVKAQRVLSSILLGTLTYDANLLVLEPNVNCE